MEGITYNNGYAYYDGKKFRKDTKTGYYLSTTKIGNGRKRLHVYVWEKNNGEIPKGYQIHHYDENKDNNEVDNLICMTKSEHNAWHAKHDRERMLPIWRESMDKARIEASKWHKSEEGRRKKSEAIKGIKHKKRYMKNCKNCGKTYRTSLQRSMFCSPKCQIAYRKKKGVDDEARLCKICGKEFFVNKYSTSRTCSKLCQDKLRLIENAKRNRGTKKVHTGKYIGKFYFQGKPYSTKSYAKERDAYEANQNNIKELLKSL